MCVIKFCLLVRRTTQVLTRSLAYAPAVQLQPLPFAYDALEPRLSRQAMTLHHTKHHAKHVAIINGMIEGTEMEKDSLEVLVLMPLSLMCLHGTRLRR